MLTKKELYTLLDYVDHSRLKRNEIAARVVENPNLIYLLLPIIEEEEIPISYRAAWILEYTIRTKPHLLYPHLDSFSKLISIVRLDSSVRPMAKICEIIVAHYFAKISNERQRLLKIQHLERITTACFDWLIDDYKVAAKAYSMSSLLLLGKKFDWIHPELKIILEQNYATGSAAYKARARMVLKKI